MGAGQSYDLSKTQYALGMNNEDKKNNESQIYRHPTSKDRDLFTHKPEFETMHEMYKAILEKNSDSEFLGRRNLLNGKLNNYFTFQNYGEIFKKAEQFGSALSDYITKSDKEYGMRFFATFSKNNTNLLISDIGCCIQGLTCVPMYDTLGDEANHFILQQTEAEVCLIESSKLEKLLTLKKEEDWYKSLKTLVILDEENLDENLYKQAKELYQVFTWEEIRKQGETNTKEWAKINPDTIYTFSYTGGTTGIPKGAMMSHRNIMSICRPLKQRVGFVKEVHLSYLPFPHILERAMFFLIISTAGKIGVFSGDKLKLIEDAQILKPSFFVSAPRFFNKVHSKICSSVETKSFLAKYLFKKALDSKLYNLKNHGIFTHGLWDKIFGNVRNLLGGNIRMFISGGAPMNKDVMDFFKVAFGVPFFEAYGQTEGTGAEFCTYGFEKISGSVGAPFEQHEFKLLDVPEMKYSHRDKDENGNSTPRGELWVRGPNVIRGYYKLPEKNKELLEDGWMKSGDIVQLSYPQNKLSIIDRKKHIFKLSQGEYVAPEKLENKYKSVNQFIANIFVYGNSNYNYVVAAINIEIGMVEKFAKEFDVEGENLLNSDALKKAVLNRFKEYAKENGLNSIEIIRDLVFDNIDWVNNGLITPAMKNKRIELRKHYEERLSKLYK